MEKYSNTNDQNRSKMVHYFDQLIHDILISRKIEQSVYNYIIKITIIYNMCPWLNWIEHQISNLRVASSNLAGRTIRKKI